MLKKDKKAVLVNKLASMPQASQDRALRKISDLIESFGMSEAEAYSRVLGGTTAMNIGGLPKKKKAKRNETKTVKR